MKPKPIWLSQKDECSAAEWVHWLIEAFLHMATWKTTDYDSLRVDNKAEFAEMVDGKELFEMIENLKRACLVKGVPLTDEVLGEFSAARIASNSPLPAADRDRLGILTSALLVLHARLSVDDETKATESEGSRFEKKPPSKVEQAINLLIKNPGWTDSQIAREVGCSQSTLSRSEDYRKWRKQADEANASRHGPGVRSRGNDMDEYAAKDE